MEPTPLARCEDLVLAAQYIEVWADTCREKAVEGSIDALLREAEMGEADHKVSLTLTAERKAAFLHGYVVALADAAELLREIAA